MNNVSTRVPTSAGMPSGRSAALLIDFDNVTMNIRTDLGKELKAMLDSDVFRGKVAVRRAYADWRRYPQSVVPLTEASVDLIFAPAYGTSKKNATDLRMAVDAIELAFMRPEIGTFILLTGDSDFSSCVMKLKEYGKYVIGVGMRESASDLLIQNCDEYYSYHNLSGLTRAQDDTGVREDPWELVTKAARQMVRNRDVMRVDRLKQVMIDLDPGFSEKDLGYSKFSKFITDAQSRGLVRLRKDNEGQWEIVPPQPGDEPQTPFDEPRRERQREEADREGGRDRDRGRDRGRSGFRDRYRGRDRERDRERERPRSYETPLEIEVDLDAAPPAAFEPSFADAPATDAPAEFFAEAPAPAEAAAEAPAGDEPRAAERPRAERPSRPAPEAPAADVDPRRNAYALLQHTVRQMARPGSTVRDGDLKRRMMELQPGFDEHSLGFSKFSRFLRQAHEDQVVDVRRQDDGGYEVLLPSSGGMRLPAPVLTAGAPAAQAADTTAGPASDDSAGLAPREGRDGRGGRGRGRRGAPSGPPPLLPGQVAGAGGDIAPVDAPSADAPPAVAADLPEMTPATAIQEMEDGALIEHRQPTVPTAQLGDPASIANRGSSTSAGAVGIRARRGGRGGRFAAEPSGPPPLLPGQGIPSSAARPADAAPAPQPEPEQPAAVQPAAEAPAEAAPQAATTFTLPTDRDAVVQHVSSYNFVGRATGEALADAYGADVWRTLDENPDAVRELLGARKARPLLEQWAAEREQHIGPAPVEAAAVEDTAPVADESAPAVAEEVVGDTDPTLMGDAVTTEAGGDEPPARGRSRGRRGGRGRGRESSAAQADEVIGDTDPTLVGDAGTGDAPAGDAEPSAPAQAEEVVGDTDPTLMGDATTELAPLDGDQPSRPRSRRGGRGRGRARAGGDAGGDAGAEAEAPAAEAPPAPAPEPEAPAAEPAADRPARPRRGRGARASADAAPVAEVPAAAPVADAPADDAPASEPAAGGRRGRGRGRAAAAPAEAAASEPAPAPAEDAGGAEGEEGGEGAARRPRRRGGRGRSRTGRANGGDAE
ncbi:MAG TPA: NYN domain-containing protein [Longimicrobium sp.]|jgi:uncharacterized protein (TIGR00288 family)|uniref:NYN domain-containing protein n=1 Tax=Longimicrobium sp. TaxID=2029185 RepID=UPI002ED880E2